MAAKLVQNNYGKSRVRLMKVERHGDHHDLQNLNIKIALEGDFDEIHITGDNSKCLPTDTMKNTVYALAAQTDKIEEIECFGLRLALWRYTSPKVATEALWNSVRQTVLETFATHDSLSVQHTLYAMGEAVLDKHPDVEEISFSLPNIHCLPVDVTRFGSEEKHAIFLPTEEPHGLIEGRLTR